MKTSYKRGLALSRSKGFTLIELLVVIAIIGILASIILASLATARSKGSDAKIEEQLGNMRAQAQLYTGTGTAVSTAVTPCAATANTLFEAANNGLGSLMPITNTICISSAGQPATGAAWAVAAQTSTGAWCVDSTGVSRSATAAGTAYSTTLSATNDFSGTSCL